MFPSPILLFSRKPKSHAFKLVLKRKEKKRIRIIVAFESLSMLVLSYLRVPLVHRKLVLALCNGNNVYLSIYVQLVFKYSLGAYSARTLRVRLFKSRNHTILIYDFHTKMTCEWLTDHLHVGSHPMFFFFLSFKHFNIGECPRCTYSS